MTQFLIHRPGPDGPVVAEGCVFGDGRTVVAWLGEHKSVAVYQSPEDMLAVHGHDRTWVKSIPEDWEMSLDPFHGDAFKGTPGEGVIVKDGPRRAMWLPNDAWGQAIGVGPYVTDHAQLQT